MTFCFCGDLSVTYIHIELHARTFRPVVWAWRSFHRYFAHFRRHCVKSEHQSLMFLPLWKSLAYHLIYFVLCIIFNVNGSKENTSYHYFDATVVHFSTQHLPYAILFFPCIAAWCLWSFLWFFCCYVLCQCFQRCLTCYELNFHSLCTLMTSFQGYYKDGANIIWLSILCSSIPSFTHQTEKNQRLRMEL